MALLGIFTIIYGFGSIKHIRVKLSQKKDQIAPIEDIIEEYEL